MALIFLYKYWCKATNKNECNIHTLQEFLNL